MEAVLEASIRDSFGKNEAGRTRRSGRVPAVLYGATGEGATKEARPISVDPKALLRILHSDSGANTLISLKLTGEHDTRVLVKDYQLDPVTHQVLHADFYRNPSWFEAAMNIMLTALTRPRSASGVESWIAVLRMTTLT